MYLDCLVKVPEIPGKIVYKKKGPSTYVLYENGRSYDPKKRFNQPKRVIIGKLSEADKSMMQPNTGYLEQFPYAELPDEKAEPSRSRCLRTGTFIVLRKIIEDYKLKDMLSAYFGIKDAGLLLDLAVYSIITESNVAQHYPDYAFNHPLLTQEMRMYSDSKVGDFLSSVTDEQRLGFLDEWNERKDKRQRIYISYDSTNKNCQAGQIAIVEKGHPKEDKGLAIYNYSIALDVKEKEPLFYEVYPGSIVDVSQLRSAVDEANGYGYRNLGFILDRGYFSKDNISYMDENGYSFVIMANGITSLVDEIVLEEKGSFEDDRLHYIKRFHVYGTTVRKRLYATDKELRSFHIYHDSEKEATERTQVDKKIDVLTEFLDKKTGTQYEASDYIKRYFDIYMEKDGDTFKGYTVKPEVIRKELKLCGYFCIVTSEKMNAKEALELYKSRDASEKLFAADKMFLGSRSTRSHTIETLKAKSFVEFIALIIRNRFYSRLKAESETMVKAPNYMTVPAAIRELEKIELIRGYDKTYRLSYAVTKKQKTILNAFGMDENYIRQKAIGIDEELKLSEGSK